MKKIGDNIIKLTGFGIYVTLIDGKLYSCPIIAKTGHPKLDPDNCIEWSLLEGPINEELTHIINSNFNTSFTTMELNRGK